MQEATSMHAMHDYPLACSCRMLHHCGSCTLTRDLGRRTRTCSSMMATSRKQWDTSALMVPMAARAEKMTTFTCATQAGLVLAWLAELTRFSRSRMQQAQAC